MTPGCYNYHYIGPGVLHSRGSIGSIHVVITPLQLVSVAAVVACGVVVTRGVVESTMHTSVFFQSFFIYFYFSIFTPLPPPHTIFSKERN